MPFVDCSVYRFATLAATTIACHGKRLRVNLHPYVYSPTMQTLLPLLLLDHLSRTQSLQKKMMTFLAVCRALLKSSA